MQSPFRFLMSLGFSFLVAAGAMAATPPSYQGLWWNAPASSESGWGLNLTHQGDILFGTWFTYDADGRGMWLVMPRADLIPMMDDGMMGYGGYMMGPMMNSSYTYSGPLYRPTGPSFDSATFDGSKVKLELVGQATLVFTDANTGVFGYSVDGVYDAKDITRLVYAKQPLCNFMPGPTANYQDLWWRSPAGSENGWGVNITHQGDILFATWFTYDAQGKAAWFVMSNGNKTGPSTYSGALARTTGPAFSAHPWNKAQVTQQEVGSATFTFTDANNGTFTAMVGGVMQTKPITRLAFSTPSTTCR